MNRIKALPAVLLALLLLITTQQSASAGSTPIAYVLEHNDRWTGKTGDAASMLANAGFDVRALPLDRSPFGLRGLIFLGSFTTESQEYQDYMRSYADDLYAFIDDSNVLLQMTQADQTEAIPPFLPTTHYARRGDTDGAVAHVLTDNPLLESVPMAGGRLSLSGTRTVWEAFEQQDGFEVMLSLDEGYANPAMMEGAYGQGRLILSAIPWDKPAGSGSHQIDEAQRQAFAAALCANLYQHVIDVRDRNTEPLDITPSTSLRFAAEGWKLAVLPDTQVYSLRNPGLFDIQTLWVARHAEELNIRYALHLGDIVNNNTPTEWDRAADSLALLGCTVPYAVVPGNHDYGPSGDASTRGTLMNEYLEVDEITEWPTFGGAMEPGKLDNTYHLFEAGGRGWIIMALEWGPRDSTIKWANSVMQEHPDRLGILITHAYMNNNDLRYDHTDTQNPQNFNPHHYATPGGVNDGEELWQELVRRHDFRLVMNGHVLGDGTGYLASENDLGHTCHQMLSNFQMRTLGGESYLRVLEFLEDGATVRVRSYSPLYDRFLTDEDQNFTIQLD